MLGASASHIRREHRFPALFGAADGFHAVLDGLKVLVVGAGSVGGRAALHLARMKVGKLLIADPKSFKGESVLTHEVSPDLIGAPKASSMAHVCKRISPETEVLYHDGAISEISITELADIEAILLASDNLTAEVEVGQMALRLGVPLLQGSVHGETLVAQVRVFGNVTGGEGPCPACLFNATEWGELQEEKSYSCAPSAAADDGAQPETQPTFSLSFLCSTAADMMMMSLLRSVLSLGQPVADTMAEYCGHSGRTSHCALRRNPECRCDHTPWTFRNFEGSAEDLTLHDLAAGSGEEVAENDADSPLFEVSGLDWVTSLVCPDGHSMALNRFVPKDKAIDGLTCPKCGRELFLEPMARVGGAALDTLGDAVRKPLREIGVHAPEWVRVRRFRSTTLYHV